MTKLDAYDLQQKLLDAWKELAPNFIASDVKKQYNNVPVYIHIDGKLIEITNIEIVDGKVVLTC